MTFALIDSFAWGSARFFVIHMGPQLTFLRKCWFKFKFKCIIITSFSSPSISKGLVVRRGSACRVLHPLPTIVQVWSRILIFLFYLPYILMMPLKVWTVISSNYESKILLFQPAWAQWTSWEPEIYEKGESRETNLETNTTQFELQTKSDKGIKRGPGLFLHKWGRVAVNGLRRPPFFRKMRDHG